MHNAHISDLAAWNTHRDEGAFRRLVESYSGMVTLVCRRQLGENDAAADAAQAVFIILAKRGATVTRPQALGAWLYQVAIGVCKTARRAALRRAQHEQEAVMHQHRQQRNGGSAEVAWTELRPELDTAIFSLGTREREVVISYFLEGLPQATVAERLGISEKTVRKDVANALAALRLWFARRGLAVGAVALAAGLAGEVQAAEPALTATYVQAGLHPQGMAAANGLASGTAGVGVAKTATLILAMVVLLGTAGGFMVNRFLSPSTEPTTPGMHRVSAPIAAAAAAESFPIGVWMQDPLHAQAYRQAGINVYVNLWNGPTEADLAALSACGMKTICNQNEVGLRHRGDPTILGWMNISDPDNALADGRGGYLPPLVPARVVEQAGVLKKNDPTRPVYLSFGQGAVWDGYPGRGSRQEHPEDYAAYSRGSDILDFHIYPVNNPEPTLTGDLRQVAHGVDRLRGWSRADQSVWCGIEATRISKDSPAKPTAAQVRAEVWLALIHGATGLVYFGHDLRPATNDSAALLHDPLMLTAVTAINQQIARLTGPLRAMTVVDGTQVQASPPSASLDILVKDYQGTRFIFAVALRDEVVTATFCMPMPRGARADVIDENRSLAVADGSFTDRFAPYAVHLYAIPSQ